MASSDDGEMLENDSLVQVGDVQEVVIVSDSKIRIKKEQDELKKNKQASIDEWYDELAEPEPECNDPHIINHIINRNINYNDQTVHLWLPQDAINSIINENDYFESSNIGIKSKPRKRQFAHRLQWRNDDMMEAMHFVNEKILTIRGAAKRYNVPYSTLKDRVRGRVMHGTRPGVKTVFSFEEEEELVRIIQLLEDAGFTPTCADIRLKASELISMQRKLAHHKFKNFVIPGHNWLAGFLKRHPTIQIRRTQNITPAPNVQKQKQTLRRFYEILHQSYKRIGEVQRVTRVFAMTILDMPSIPSIRIVVATTADGSILPPYVLLLKASSKNLIEQLRATYPEATFVLAGSETHRKSGKSSMDLREETLFAWFNDHFTRFLPRNLMGQRRPAVLLLCQPVHSMSIRLLQLACDESVLLVSMPASIQHLIHPITELLLIDLKFNIATRTQEWIVENNQQDMADMRIKAVAPVLLKVWEELMTPDRICSGFLNNGVYPFNPHAISHDRILNSNLNPSPHVNSAMSYSGSDIKVENTNPNVKSAFNESIKKCEESHQASHGLQLLSEFAARDRPIAKPIRKSTLKRASNLLSDGSSPEKMSPSSDYLEEFSDGPIKSKNWHLGLPPLGDEDTNCCRIRPFIVDKPLKRDRKSMNMVNTVAQLKLNTHDGMVLDAQLDAWRVNEAVESIMKEESYSRKRYNSTGLTRHYKTNRLNQNSPARLAYHKPIPPPPSNPLDLPDWLDTEESRTPLVLEEFIPQDEFVLDNLEPIEDQEIYMLIKNENWYEGEAEDLENRYITQNEGILQEQHSNIESTEVYMNDQRGEMYNEDTCATEELPIIKFEDTDRNILDYNSSNEQFKKENNIIKVGMEGIAKTNSSPNCKLTTIKSEEIFKRGRPAKYLDKNLKKKQNSYADSDIQLPQSSFPKKSLTTIKSSDILYPKSQSSEESDSMEVSQQKVDTLLELSSDIASLQNSSPIKSLYQNVMEIDSNEIAFNNLPLNKTKKLDDSCLIGKTLSKQNEPKDFLEGDNEFDPNQKVRIIKSIKVNNQPVQLIRIATLADVFQKDNYEGCTIEFCDE